MNVLTTPYNVCTIHSCGIPCVGIAKNLFGSNAPLLSIGNHPSIVDTMISDHRFLAVIHWQVNADCSHHVGGPFC